jgi:hypothetical protein
MSRAKAPAYRFSPKPARGRAAASSLATESSATHQQGEPFVAAHQEAVYPSWSAVGIKSERLGSLQQSGDDDPGFIRARAAPTQ